MTRPGQRNPDQMRSVSIIRNINPYAEGSAEVCFGNTKVLCTASVETDVPGWLRESGGGWVTAEYGMLPRSTHSRMRRESTSGKQGGRTLEIQRLIARSLRRAVDVEKLNGITIKVDCDVICADGGTRTAAISGGWVALKQAIDWAKNEKLIDSSIEVCPIAAVSVGVVSGQRVLDLCYEEDSSADFDLNLVFNDKSNLIEIQGTAEKGDIVLDDLNAMLELGIKGSKEIFSEQAKALS